MSYALRRGTRANDTLIADNIRSRVSTTTILNTGTLSVENDAGISGNLVVDGTTTIGGGVDIGGSTQIDGELDIGGALDVSGSGIFGGALDVAGDGVFDGDITTNNNLGVSGDVDIGGDLSVSGDVTLDSSLNVLGNVIINGDLTVIQESTLSETTYIHNDIFYTVAQTIEQPATFFDRVTICGELDVSGDASFNTIVCHDQLRFPNKQIRITEDATSFVSQGTDTIVIGRQAGTSNQGTESIAIGHQAGQSSQGTQSVAIGHQAGQSSQGKESVAIGYYSGVTNQGDYAVAIGRTSAQGNQGDGAVSVGNAAGDISQGTLSVAVGYFAGYDTQGTESVAVGHQAGRNSQGKYAVAVGFKAGLSGQADNSIVLNARSTQLDTTTSGFFVKPVREQDNTAGWTPPGTLWYEPSTGELASQPDISQGTIAVDLTISGDLNVRGDINGDPGSVLTLRNTFPTNPYGHIHLLTSGAKDIYFGISDPTTDPQGYNINANIGSGNDFGLDFFGKTSISTEEQICRFAVSTTDSSYQPESGHGGLTVEDTIKSDRLLVDTELGINIIPSGGNVLDVSGDGRVRGDFRVDGSFNIGPASVTMWEDAGGNLTMAHSTASTAGININLHDSDNTAIDSGDSSRGILIGPKDVPASTIHISKDGKIGVGKRIEGDASLYKTLDISGDVEIGGGMNVTGTTELGNDVTVAGDLLSTTGSTGVYRSVGVIGTDRFVKLVANGTRASIESANGNENYVTGGGTNGVVSKTYFGTTFVSVGEAGDDGPDISTNGDTAVLYLGNARYSLGSYASIPEITLKHSAADGAYAFRYLKDTTNKSTITMEAGKETNDSIQLLSNTSVSGNFGVSGNIEVDGGLFIHDSEIGVSGIDTSKVTTKQLQLYNLSEDDAAVFKLASSINYYDNTLHDRIDIDLTHGTISGSEWIELSNGDDHNVINHSTIHPTIHARIPPNHAWYGSKLSHVNYDVMCDTGGVNTGDDATYGVAGRDFGNPPDESDKYASFDIVLPAWLDSSDNYTFPEGTSVVIYGKGLAKGPNSQRTFLRLIVPGYNTTTEEGNVHLNFSQISPDISYGLAKYIDQEDPGEGASALSRIPNSSNLWFDLTSVPPMRNLEMNAWMRDSNGGFDNQYPDYAPGTVGGFAEDNTKCIWKCECVSTTHGWIVDRFTITNGEGNTTIPQNLVVKKDANVTGDLLVDGDISTTSTLYVNGTTTLRSGANITGDLLVDGDISTTSTLYVNGTTQSTSSSTGALVVSGGIGVAKDIVSYGNIQTNSGSFVTFSQISGDVKGLNVWGPSGSTLGRVVNDGAFHIHGQLSPLYINGSGRTPFNNENTILNTNNGNVGIGISDPDSNYKLDVNGSIKTTGNIRITDNVYIDGTTQSTSSSTGALVVSGGIGVAKDIVSYGNIQTNSGSFVTFSQTNGDVRGLNVWGPNGSTLGRVVNDGLFHIHGQVSNVYINASGRTPANNEKTILNTNNGNVGIGTSNPDLSYKLDVDGNIRTNGNVSIGVNKPVNTYKLDVYGNVHISNGFIFCQDLVIANQGLESRKVLGNNQLTSASTINKVVIGYNNNLNSSNNSNAIVFEGRSGGVPVSRAQLAINKQYFATIQHPVRVNKSVTNDYYGLLFKSSGKYMNPPTLNEAHIYVELCENMKDKRIYGILSQYDFVINSLDENNVQIYSPYQPQHTEDTKISYVSSGGEGMIWVCDIGGPIEKGDYICSSQIPGLGMLQDDDLRHNYTCFKSAIDCDFETPSEYTYPKYDMSGTERIWNDSSDGFTYSYITESIFEVYEGVIMEDRYILKRGDTVIKNIVWDFATNRPELVGMTFKAALIGGQYTCE